ncbi:MAG: response regulator [Clostridiales bacterium]
MYSIIVIDDEFIVREGVKKNISWNEYGFDLVGDCENGFEAIEYIDELKPDVVITDICMPFIDGIELSRYITEKHPLTKIILLTGYDDFEYAQQAVKLKIFDYILKPITATELRKVLVKLKKELDEEVKKLDDLNRLKVQLNESLPLLKERYLNNLISGNLKNYSNINRLNHFGIDKNKKNFLVFVSDLDSSSESSLLEEDQELFYYAVYNICEEITNENTVVFQNNDNLIVAILSFDKEDEILEYSYKVTEKIRQTVEKYLKVTITTGIGEICYSIFDISKSYKSACSALDYRFIAGNNKVINISDFEGKSIKDNKINIKWEGKIVFAIKTSTLDDIESTIFNFVKYIKESKGSIEDSYYQIQLIVISIIGYLNELEITQKDVFGNTNILNQVYKLKTLEETKKWLKEICFQTSDYISGKRENYCKVQALKAKDYILKNYSDKNLNLSSICKYILVSTSYFSSFFKIYTGYTFVEYLTKVRIEKASELLKSTDLKTYEIAEKVGYSDPHYFSLIFKKIMSFTPSYYRNNL